LSLPQLATESIDALFTQLVAPATFRDPPTPPPRSAPLPPAKPAPEKVVYSDPLGLLAEAASAVRDCVKDGDAGQGAELEKDVGIASCAYFDEVQSPATSFANFLESAPIMKLITLEE
jgi:hypothetical protein